MRGIKWYNRIVEILTCVIALLAISMVLPKAFGMNPYIVESGSMEPVIHTGAVAYIDFKDTSIEVGDIVTYQLVNGQMVTHRVKAVTSEGYVFKGDANDATDAHIVTQDQIIGTYKFQVPNLGYLIGKLGKKGIVLIIGWVIALNLIGIILEHTFGSSSSKENCI